MAVISDVGRALRTLLGHALPAGAEIHFSPPAVCSAGAAQLPAQPAGAGPAGGVYLVLCWVRADPNGRQSGERDVRAADGSLLGRQAPARRYELRYLVTARAPTAEAEHELLDAVLLAVTELDALPSACLPKSLADCGLPVMLQVCSEPPAGSVPDHAGFALLISPPLLPPLRTELAPPAAELAIGLRRTPPTPSPPAPSPPAPSPPAPSPPAPSPPAPSSPAPPNGRQWRRRAHVVED